MVVTKQPTSFRLSGECVRLMNRLAAALGISQAGVIEQAVRKLARAELPGEAPSRGRARPAHATPAPPPAAELEHARPRLRKKG